MKIRSPGFVLGDHFSVNNSVGGKISERLCNLRESFVEVLVVARIQDRFAARSDPNGAVAVQLHFIRPFPALGKRRKQGAFHRDLSPDGSHLAFWKTPQAPIEILSLNGNARRSYYVKGWDNLDSLDWTADGKVFFVFDSVHGGTVLLHVDLQGNAGVLQKSQGEGADVCRQSPDGRHLAIGAGRVNGNMWTLENF